MGLRIGRFSSSLTSEGFPEIDCTIRGRVILQGNLPDRGVRGKLIPGGTTGSLLSSLNLHRGGETKGLRTPRKGEILLPLNVNGGGGGVRLLGAGLKCMIGEVS